LALNPAGQTAYLSGNATCYGSPNGTCASYQWVVACPPTNTTGAVVITAPGPNASITTGVNNGTATFQINTFGLGSPLLCGVTFSATGAPAPLLSRAGEGGAGLHEYHPLRSCLSRRAQ
jgi:hypothetical protein